MNRVDPPVLFLSAKPLVSDQLRRSLEQSSAGAVVVFEGVVRDHHQGRSVVRLEYSAFDPVVEAEWQNLRERARASFEVKAITGQHRVGTLGIGDSAVWIGVASAHRASGFAACQWLIEAIKRELPIWKKEHYADGSIDWRHDVGPDPARTVI